jgi:hypothetical protein
VAESGAHYTVKRKFKSIVLSASEEFDGGALYELGILLIISCFVKM